MEKQEINLWTTTVHHYSQSFSTSTLLTEFLSIQNIYFMSVILTISSTLIDTSKSIDLHMIVISLTSLILKYRRQPFPQMVLFITLDCKFMTFLL